MTDRKVAIVTGASGGIGRAICDALIASGHDVAMVDIFPPDDIPDHAHFLQQDITETEDLQGLVKGIAETIGPPAVLVNNAAVGKAGAIAEITPETYDRVFAVSTRASFFLTQAVAPYMQRSGGGTIINVASLIAGKGDKANSHYAGAKAALVGFTRAWAIEFAPHHISCNAILPALTDTPMTRGAMGQQAIDAKIASVPMGRLATTRDCGVLAAYLASPNARFMTGQVISPNGGEFAGAL